MQTNRTNKREGMDAPESRYCAAVRRLFDEKIYAGLNNKQKEAVYCVNGPLLVLAGAGSGKTTVLVNRISHIIRFGDLYNISAGTRADDETAERLSAAADSDISPEDAAELLAEYAAAPCPPWAMLAITFTNKAANEMKSRLERTLSEKAEEIWAGTFHSIGVRILRRYGDRIGYNRGFRSTTPTIPKGL